MASHISYYDKIREGDTSLRGIANGATRLQRHCNILPEVVKTRLRTGENDLRLLSVSIRPVMEDSIQIVVRHPSNRQPRTVRLFREGNSPSISTPCIIEFKGQAKPAYRMICNVALGRRSLYLTDSMVVGSTEMDHFGSLAFSGASPERSRSESRHREPSEKKPVMGQV